MKAFRILITIITVGSLLAYSGCKPKGGTPETTQDKQLGLLSTTWKIFSVSQGGTDVTSSWKGFSVAITGTKGATSFQYSCAGRPALSPWPASGTWAFGTDPVTQIIRDKGSVNDELAMTYSVNATKLQVGYNFPSTRAGYTKVDGDWVFTFNK